MRQHLLAPQTLAFAGVCCFCGTVLANQVLFLVVHPVPKWVGTISGTAVLSLTVAGSYTGCMSAAQLPRTSRQAAAGRLGECVC